MKMLKKIDDFLIENQITNQVLDLVKIQGGKALGAECCNESWDTSGGDCEEWTYSDASGGGRTPIKGSVDGVQTYP